MIVFSDILKMLSDHGWSSYRLVQEHVFGNSTITRLRKGTPLNTETIDKVCELCDCQPGDLMRYVPDDQGE